MKLAIVASHPVQYYAPLFRTLAQQLDLTVFYGHRDSSEDQARAGFGVGFAWDVDLLSGYDHVFLDNTASNPGLGRFSGVDTPEIGDRLRSGGFDGVLLLGWYLKSFIQALVVAKRAGISVMVRGDSQLGTPRSSLKTLVKSAAYPLFLRQFDAALVVGERNRAYWRHYGYPAARMFDSPHCIDTAWFAERATPAARAAVRDRFAIAPDTRIALFAGKLLEFKRPGDFIAGVAAARARGVPVEAMIAGSGPLEAEVRAQAIALGVPLHMLGFCNQSEMPGAYAAADVLVLPSTGRETWGLVANEALASGCPVVLSDAVGSAPDLATDARVGQTFPLGDVDACGQRLAAMLSLSPDKQAVAEISTRYSLDAAAQGVARALAAIPRS
ncbi:glycosyltransferase family 4 protein [Novosphingobium sp.]|uniref:glycosyltransferase family 4 protein n=1 Tax=Novosphingobium sp. TaxID=1874826 RepID=UPI0025F5A8F3|nr:glycosyltransferase family 4 protein [Novosphingobium sp.]